MRHAELDLRTEVVILNGKIAALTADNAALRAALLKNRQGYVNILEMRKLSGEQWGERDGYGGRYGALTREEIEAVIAEIDATVAAHPESKKPE